MPTKEDSIWEEIDHDLISRERRFRRIQYDAERVSCSTLLDIPPAHIQAIRKTVEQTYGLYREVWQLQGKPASPEFIAVVYRKAVIPLLRRSSSSFEHYVRHGKSPSILSVFNRSFMALVLVPMFDELARTLEQEWNERLMIEAKRCKYQLATSLTPASSLAADASGSTNGDRTARTAQGSSRLDIRKATITKIYADHPKWTALEVCREMDKRADSNRNLSPLPSWSSRLWVDARKSHRLRVDRYISRVRKAIKRL